MTLAALALRECTGEVSIPTNHGTHLIAFDGGRIVGAQSPSTAVTVLRIAMAGGFVNPLMMAELTSRIAADRGRDEVEVIAEAAGLSPSRELRLRRRVIAHAVARTFGIPHGEFVVDSSISLPRQISRAPIDVWPVVYLGARMMPPSRIASELSGYGARFALKADAADVLPRFGFSKHERPLIAALQGGASIAQLESWCAPEVEPHVIHAVVYTLVSCLVAETSLDTPATTLARGSVTRMDRHAIGTPSIYQPPADGDPYEPLLAVGSSTTIPPPVFPMCVPEPVGDDDTIPTRRPCSEPTAPLHMTRVN
jgi:hypothetical protein